jgi:Xaa-Pro aminopeptidase
MAEENVGLMFLTPGANLFYLTGIPHRDTDHNAYGDWAVGGYIGLDKGVVMTAPRMGGEYFQTEVEDKPWFEPVRIIDESEDPLDVMRHVLSRFDLKGKKVALEDHSWAQTVQAFRHLLPDTEFVLTLDLIAPMRMIKDDTELDLMRKTGQICDSAFRKALDRLKLGVRHARHLPDTLRIFGLELDEEDLAAIEQVVGKAKGPVGDVYALERSKGGKHAAIIKYNLNKE